MIKKLLILFLFQISFISSSQVDDLQQEVGDFAKKHFANNASSSLIDLSPTSIKLIKSFLGRGNPVGTKQISLILNMVIAYYKNNFSTNIDNQIVQDMNICDQVIKALESKNDEKIKHLTDAGFLTMEGNDFSSALFSFEKVIVASRLFAARCHISKVLFSSLEEDSNPALLIAFKFMNSKSNGCCLDFGSYDRLEQSIENLQEYFLRTNMIDIIQKSLLEVKHNQWKMKIEKEAQKMEEFERSTREKLEKDSFQQHLSIIKQSKKDLIKQKTAEDNKVRKPYFEHWRETFDKKLAAFKVNERHREHVEKVRLERALLPKVLDAEIASTAMQIGESTLTPVAESGVKNTVANVQVLEARKARRLQRLEERERSKMFESKKKFQAEQRERAIRENFMTQEHFFEKFKRYGLEKEQSCYCSNCSWYEGKSVKYLGSVHGGNLTEKSSYFGPDCNESMCRHKSAIKKHCACLDCTVYRQKKLDENAKKSRIIDYDGSWRHNPFLPRL